MLPDTVEKSTLVRHSPQFYVTHLIDAAIVGINNYASQVVQTLSDVEYDAILALIADIIPDIAVSMSEAGLKTSLDLESDGSMDNTLTDERVVSKTLDRLSSSVADDDSIIQTVRTLIFEDQVSGVLFSGVPGTGKTFYAREVGINLVDGDPRRLRQIQLHQGYQYEDFVEGFAPAEDGSFKLQNKILLETCAVAAGTSDPVVLIIDELSRSDAGRVFGEALTYMERSQRNIEFRLPSGRLATIPDNLVFLATMNPEDRSIDELDAAMERRWSKVAFEPDPKALERILHSNSMDAALIGPTISLFVQLQNFGSLGHGLFVAAKDGPGLMRCWRHQIRHLYAKRFRYEDDQLDAIDQVWTEFAALTGIDQQPT